MTTKLRGARHGYDAALAGFERFGRPRPRTTWISSLIHGPLPGRDLYVDTWRAFIKLPEQGLAPLHRGLQFHTGAHRAVFDETGVTPAVSQIEIQGG